jgi:hypothetical protein
MVAFLKLFKTKMTEEVVFQIAIKNDKPEFNLIKGNNNIINITIDNQDANAMQNIADKKMEEITAKESEFDCIKNDVIFTFSKADTEGENKNTDKGFIYSICDKAITTTYESDSIKQQMLGIDDKNPFSYEYLVDVKVIFNAQTKKPSFYKILKYSTVVGEIKFNW